MSDALARSMPVLYLYEFTLLSNSSTSNLTTILSYTSMNLHYSQTTMRASLNMTQSYTSMNLHYSQTESADAKKNTTVLYLYEFTLLSNAVGGNPAVSAVLYLYEFTLLSNEVNSNQPELPVLYLYEFTLLSNNTYIRYLAGWSYTSMNLHYSQTRIRALSH